MNTQFNLENASIWVDTAEGFATYNKGERDILDPEFVKLWRRKVNFLLTNQGKVV